MIFGTIRYLSAAALLVSASVMVQAQTPEAVEFVFETAPFASAHASTIVETRDGLVAAWFGGTREGASDVGIWLSRRVDGKWTPPVEVATGVQADGTRHPTWNPVLFELRRSELTLFYKVGPNPRSWWGMARTSTDGGRTWSAARRLPDGFLGPVKNKPVRLSDGTILASSSTESPEAPSSWRVHFERSRDNGGTWDLIRPAPGAAQPIDAIQPSILTHSDGRLQAVGRTRSGRLFETWSADRGQTWTPVALTALPNPSAGTDAVTLRDGRHLLVYNHTAKGRTPLNVAVTRDGKVWEAAYVLENEPGEYSYPAVIQSSDGLVHITYTWRRERIKHVVIDPAKLKTVSMPDGEWPSRLSADSLPQAAPQFREHVEVSRILIDARVLDNAGNPIGNLGSEDFSLKVGGRTARIDSLEWISGATGEALSSSGPDGLRETSTAAPGRLIVLVFQKSLEPSRIMGFLRMLIQTREFLHTLGPRDRVAVALFDTRLHIWADFTRDLERLGQILQHGILFEPPPGLPGGVFPSLVERMPPEQVRRTYTIEHSLRLIGEALDALPGAKSIVLVGHGFGRFTADGSVRMENGYEQMRKTLQDARVSVFCLDVTDADYHSLEHGLKFVARDTGGFFERTHLFHQRALDRLAGALSGYYVLSVEKPALEPGNHGIELKLTRRKGNVLARSTYVEGMPRLND
jgi:VWFA-related protein